MEKLIFSGYLKLGGLFSIFKNFQTARFSTLNELQCGDHAQKLPFEILLEQLVGGATGPAACDEAGFPMAL